MDTTNEYDATPAGASGWAVYQDKSSNDVPGLHPFGNDWEFYLALDTQYLNLVSKGNTTLKPVDELVSLNAPAMNVPQDVITAVKNRGYLGVESEQDSVDSYLLQANDPFVIFGVRSSSDAKPGQLDPA